MEEKWMIINNWDNYAVSNKGKVKNVRTGRELKLVENKNGYLIANLCQNGKKASFRVHRLVALMFIENPELKEEVNHIDGNKKNNCVENLEWNTHKENDSHARKNGLKHDNKPVKLTNLESGKSYIFFSIAEASKMLGLHNSSLCRALKKRKGIYHGYKIEYI